MNIFLYFTKPLPVCSVSRNAKKSFAAHRPEETICSSRAGSIRCFLFTICGWKQEVIFHEIISIFCVHGRTSIVQISGVLSLTSKKRLALDKVFISVSSTAFVHL